MAILDEVSKNPNSSGVLTYGREGSPPGMTLDDQGNMTLLGTLVGIVATNGMQNVLSYGADPTGVAVSTAALVAAHAAAGPTGTVYYPPGTYKTDATLVILGNVEASPDAIISYTGAGLAVQINNDVSGLRLQRKRITLPQIICATKPVTGWNAGGIGLKTINLGRSILTYTRIQGFETGLLFYGNGEGSAYLNVNAGHLDNNKVNMMFDGTGGGYANQNTIVGGSWSHNSGEGVNVAGTKHIYMADITGAGDPNNNVFLNPSIESPTVVEYAMDIQGSYNIFIDPRFEYTGGHASVIWRAGAIRNMIFGGYDTDAILQTYVTGSFCNSVFGTGSARLQTLDQSGWVFENSGSSAYATATGLRVGGMAAGDNPLTAYTWRQEANAYRMKKFNDAFERVVLDGSNGIIKLGFGSAAAATQWSIGLGSPEGVVTAGIGSMYARTNGDSITAIYTKATGTGNTGWVERGTFNGPVRLGNTTAPAAVAGGGYLYVESGALKYIGSGGTVTVIGPA